MAEVYRAGIEAVPRGQMEAARSLGMSHRQAMRNVIVPQAVTQDPGADAERIHHADEGHDAGQRDRASTRSVLVGSEHPVAETFNSSALTLAAIMFLVITLPLARLVDKLIARNQGQITRGAHIEVA